RASSTCNCATICLSRFTIMSFLYVRVVVDEECAQSPQEHGKERRHRGVEIAVAEKAVDEPAGVDGDAGKHEPAPGGHTFAPGAAQRAHLRDEGYDEHHQHRHVDGLHAGADGFASDGHSRPLHARNATRSVSTGLLRNICASAAKPSRISSATNAEAPMTAACMVMGKVESASDQPSRTATATLAIAPRRNARHEPWRSTTMPRQRLTTKPMVPAHMAVTTMMVWSVHFISCPPRAPHAGGEPTTRARYRPQPSTARWKGGA